MNRRVVVTIAIASIFGAGIGAVALRYASIWWSSGLFTVTITLLCTAVLQVCQRRGVVRSCWLGFAVFGWAYIIMGTGPLLDDRKGLPFFVSDVIFNELQTFFAASGNRVASFSFSASTDYRYVTLSLGTLLFASIGALISYVSRDRGGTDESCR